METRCTITVPYLQKEQIKEDNKIKRKEARVKLREERRSGTKSLTDLVKDVETKTAQFESNEEFVATERERMGSGKSVEGSLKAYYKEFRKVLRSTKHRTALCSKALEKQ